jgi:hypothetical protein
MKKMKNYLKFVTLFIGTSILLWNCQKEEVSDITQQNTNSIKIKTVSLEAAKNQFQTFQNNQPKAKGTNILVVTPNWNTLNQEPLFYTNAMLTKVDVTINREGNFTTEVLFIEVNGEMKNVIYTLYIDSMTSNGNLKNARVYLTELNGDYIDGYGFENGLITTRFLPKKDSYSTSSKNSAAKYAYPTSFWGESSSTETGGDGDSNGGGSCDDCIELEEVTVNSYLKPKTFSDVDDFFNPINEFTDINDNETYSDVTNGISVSTIKEVTTAVVIDPVAKCKSGFILINGDCVVDTESPCDKPGYVRDENGICGPPKTDKIIDSLLIGKAKCLNDKLVENGNTFVKDLLAKFNGISEFDINISSKDKIYSEERQVYANGQTSHKFGDKFINISISTDKISNMPVLAGIRTILHEYIHADIYRKLNTKDINSSEVKDFKVTYQLYENEKHHNSMADLYINSMANALKNIHSAILLNEANFISTNYGNQSLDDLYEALAWQGLKEHKLKAWLDKGSDTTRINNILLIHYNGLTINCPQ